MHSVRPETEALPARLAHTGTETYSKPVIVQSALQQPAASTSAVAHIDWQDQLPSSSQSHHHSTRVTVAAEHVSPTPCSATSHRQARLVRAVAQAAETAHAAHCINKKKKRSIATHVTRDAHIQGLLYKRGCSRWAPRSNTGHPWEPPQATNTPHISARLHRPSARACDPPLACATAAAVVTNATLSTQHTAHSAPTPTAPTAILGIAAPQDTLQTHARARCGILPGIPQRCRHPHDSPASRSPTPSPENTRDVGGTVPRRAAAVAPHSRRRQRRGLRGKAILIVRKDGRWHLAFAALVSVRRRIRLAGSPRKGPPRGGSTARGGG